VVTGILTGDTLVGVIDVTTPAALTSEFTVSDDDEIDNTGGTNTTGKNLLVTWTTPGA